jgi:AbrB family looped-hinge helix DNA binding protein
MSHIDITKMSSRGQVVIPLDLRKGISEGDKLVVMRNGDQIILKKATAFDTNIKEDLEFARRTEEAWKSYERGEFKEVSLEEFFREIRSLKK